MVTYSFSLGGLSGSDLGVGVDAIAAMAWGANAPPTSTGKGGSEESTPPPLAVVVWLAAVPTVVTCSDRTTLHACELTHS